MKTLQSRCTRHTRHTRRQRGISIVEIMVGLAVGLVLMAGVAGLVVGSRQTSRVERSLLELQATGRAAVDLIAREVRKAGFRSDRERALADLFPAGAAPFVTAGSVVAGFASDSGIDFRFQGSGDNWTTDCLGNAIGDGQEVRQTLWLEGGELRCRARNLTTNSDQTLALIPQVEALSITYGIDDDGDGFADTYRAAAAVTDWSRVASVNVQVRLVSGDDGLADAAQPYLGFDGTAVTPGDRRLRRNYAAVVALRNLLP
ncbi:MAG: PilW family protein [Rubrivivax sp.]|nr:PilW family protein [Rubrivivax sp.]